MTSPGDTSPEMHNNELSPNDVDRLLASPAELSAGVELDGALAELRGLANQVATPSVSPMLAEFVGVDLAPTPAPIIDANDAEAWTAPVASDLVHNVRRKPLIGQLAAFLGTLGGKVCVGTTVAAASFGGAAATGAVDVPFFDDEPAAVETVEIEDPDALAFVEDDEAADNEPEAVEAEETDTPDKAVEEPTAATLDDLERKNAEEFDPNNNEPSAPIEDDKPDEEPEASIDGDSDPQAAENQDADEKDEGDSADKDDHDKDAGDKDTNESDEKEDHTKEGEDKPEKTEAEEELLELIGALDEELHANKDQVRADARELIEPLEDDRKELVEALESEKETIVNEWAPTIEQLELDLEHAESEEAREEIEASLDEARSARDSEIEAAELAAQPAIDEIDESLETIELERDAELNRLIAEFLAAVAELEGNA